MCAHFVNRSQNNRFKKQKISPFFWKEKLSLHRFFKGFMPIIIKPQKKQQWQQLQEK